MTTTLGIIKCLTSKQTINSGPLGPRLFPPHSKVEWENIQTVGWASHWIKLCIHFHQGAVIQGQFSSILPYLVFTPKFNIKAVSPSCHVVHAVQNKNKTIMTYTEIPSQTNMCFIPLMFCSYSYCMLPVHTEDTHTHTHNPYRCELMNAPIFNHCVSLLQRTTNE